MWHNTINQALQAGNVDLGCWPVGENLGYNQTARLVHNGLFVSVCRDDRGMYETAISYESLCENFFSVVEGI